MKGRVVPRERRQSDVDRSTRRSSRPRVVAASLALSVGVVGRHRPSISRGSALHDDAGGFLTPRSSALIPAFPGRRAQWRCEVQAPWPQWRGPCRTCTDFPVLHRRRECSRRTRSGAAERRGRRLMPRRGSVTSATPARNVSNRRKTSGLPPRASRRCTRQERARRRVQMWPRRPARRRRTARVWCQPAARPVVARAVVAEKPEPLTRVAERLDPPRLALDAATGTHRGLRVMPLAASLLTGLLTNRALPE